MTYDDLSWILKNNTDDTKGFWRIDKNKPLEIRRTTLTLAAYKDLLTLGINKFIIQNKGEGWYIPTQLGIKQLEGGLIEINSSIEQYDVVSKLGPRFLSWQLDLSHEECWKECEMHARNILGEEGFKKFKKDLEDGKYDISPADDTTSQKEDVLKVMEKARSTHQEALDGKRKQKGLFDFGGDEQ
jgi:hypothetical protein